MPGVLPFMVLLQQNQSQNHCIKTLFAYKNITEIIENIIVMKINYA